MSKSHGHHKPAGEPPREAGGAAAPGPAEPTPAPQVATAPAAPETPPAGDEIAALKDRLLRLQADFDNFRKRTQRDRAETIQRANEDLLNALLPVVDHYEMGLNTARKEGASPGMLDGLKLVYDQFLGVLARFGVTPVDAVGQPFDHNLHEAVSHAPSSEYPADTVMAQTRRGYRMGDRLLRAAQVVVSSGPAETPPVPGETPPSE